MLIISDLCRPLVLKWTRLKGCIPAYFPCTNRLDMCFNCVAFPGFHRVAFSPGIKSGNRTYRYFNSLLLNMAHRHIWFLYINSMVIFHSYVNVYQRVISNLFNTIPSCKIQSYQDKLKIPWNSSFYWLNLAIEHIHTYSFYMSELDSHQGSSVP